MFASNYLHSFVGELLIRSGCTSGHGVCGLANLPPRSLTAMLTFMGTAMVVVFLVRHVLPSCGF